MCLWVCGGVIICSIALEDNSVHRGPSFPLAPTKLQPSSQVAQGKNGLRIPSIAVMRHT